MNCNNKYKNLYNHFSMSEKKVKEIKNMTVENATHVRRPRFKYALAIAAIITLFIMGNVVTYAVTGETAVKKVVNVVKSATINKTEEYIDDDGNQHVKFELNDSVESEEVEIIIADNNFKVDISEIEDEHEGVFDGVEIIISDTVSDTSETDNPPNNDEIN